MKHKHLPFAEAGSKRIPMRASIQEVKAWRTREFEARRPSSLDDYCRAHGLQPLCPACQGEGITKNENGVGSKAVGWNGDEQLFEQCPICDGTGRLINPPIETDTAPSA